MEKHSRKIFVVPPPPSAGVPPENKTSSRDFFCKENLHVTFTLPHCAPYLLHCFICHKVKNRVATPCVYTQNTQFFPDNSIVDENHVVPNTISVQTSVRDCLYPSG